MGFSRDEIQEALTNNRYDEVMATYLLLDEKRQKLTVRLIFLVLNLLIEYTQGDLLTVKTGDTSIPRKEIKLKFIIQYSQLSANGHSHKPTALLTDAFSNPRFTSQSNSVLTHSCKRTLTRKRTRTLLKLKLGFFFCLCSLVSGHPMYNDWLLAMEFVFILQ